MSDDQPITHNLSPSHPLNNRHHNGGYRDEQDYYESMFDRGPGDPDFNTPPWEIPCVHDDLRIRPVVGYEDKYIVAANGKVYSKTRKERAHGAHTRTRRGRWLKETGATYKGVELTDRKRKSVHRIVAEAFIPNPTGLPFINHKDCNPAHNCANNLHWCSQAENIQYAVNIGRTARGADKPGAKLTVDKVREIRELLAAGRTQHELARTYEVSRRLIFNIKNNLAWKDAVLICRSSDDEKWSDIPF